MFDVWSSCSISSDLRTITWYSSTVYSMLFFFSHTHFTHTSPCSLPVPAYIERSCLIVALVPPCIHSDREGEACDQGSWRGRGWCRVEYLGASLARGECSVMLVEDPQDTPTFVLPSNALTLLAGFGSFTCCARNHEGMVCDKHPVAAVLSTMIDTKVDYLWSLGKALDARIFTALKSWFLRGLPNKEQDTVAEGSGKESKSGTGNVVGGEGLASARKLFRWRDDATEAEETRRCGVGLIFWCALSNNVEAVQELARMVAVQEGDSGDHCSNESNNALIVHRPDLFAFFLKGFTPLFAAVSFSSWPVVEALLEMGACPTAILINDWNPLMAMSWTGRAEIIKLWCERFPTWNMSQGATAVSVTAIGLALLSGPNRMDTVKALIAGGADPTAFTSQCGTTILHSAAANKDADAALFRYLLKLPGVKKLVNVPQIGQTLKWKVKFIAARCLVRLGSKKAILLNACEWPKLTPLMTAARNGNAAVIKVLVEEGRADITLRNARGHTALDLLVGGENALAESRRLLGGEVVKR